MRAWVSRHEPIIALALLVALGVALRALFVIGQRPALLGFHDSLVYLDVAAGGSLFEDPMRPAGYPLFVRLLGPLATHLPVLISIQHLLGVITALVWYAALREAAAPRGVGLAVGGAVLLQGQRLFLEHAAVSETLGMLLAALLAWTLLRWRRTEALRWLAVAGGLIGLGVTVRAAAAFLAPVAGLWVLAVAPPAWRRRLTAAAVLGLTCVAVVGGYLAAHHREKGSWSLTRAGTWNLYGRVGAFADCDRFTPPAGTEALCETTPPDERPGPSAYVFDATLSPAVRAFGDPFVAGPEAAQRVTAFARAAVLAQPGDYLLTVARDLARVVDPGYVRPTRGWGPTPAQLTEAVLVDPERQRETERLLAEVGYTGTTPHRSDGAMAVIEAVDRLTRVPPPLMLLLVVLAAAGPFAAPRGHRATAALLAGIALAIVLAPALTVFYNARYVVPAVAPLVGAAGLGAWGLARRVRAVREPASPAS